MANFLKKYGMLSLALGLLAAAGCNGGGCNELGPSTLSPSQVMLNATWETGDTTSWTQLNGSSSLAVTTTADLSPHAGLFSFASSGSPAEAYASLSNTPTNTIEISFSLLPHKPEQQHPHRNPCQPERLGPRGPALGLGHGKL